MKIIEQLEALKQPVNKSLLRSKTLKGNRIDYIPWVHLVDLLNERVGLAGWEWKMINQIQMGSRLTQIWELTIIGDDRSISRQASGDEEVDLRAFGSPATNTEAQCLRRCCAKFGLGLDLWRKGGMSAPSYSGGAGYKSQQYPSRHRSAPTPSPVRNALPPSQAPKSEGEISPEEWRRRFKQ